MASEEMERVIKLLLYIFLNSACSRGEGEDFSTLKDKCGERQFFLQERFADTLLQPRRSAIFLKTRNYFSNKLSGTLELDFDDVACTLSLKGMFH